MKRLSMINPFEEPSVVFPYIDILNFPRSDSRQFKKFTLQELEENRDTIFPHGLKVPVLPESHKWALYDLGYLIDFAKKSLIGFLIDIFL